MNRNRLYSISLVVILVVVAVGQSRPVSAAKLPGNWKVVFEPYKSEDNEDLPVEVLGLKAEIAPEGNVVEFTKYHFSNHTAKPITRIEISGFVVDQAEPKKVLHRRVLHRLGIALGAFEGESEYRSSASAKNVVGFSDTEKGIITPLVVNGELNGNYLVKVRITKAWFRDGSTWELKEPKE